MGPFSINMWFRANASDMDGDLFEYIFSHSDNATRRNFAAVDTFDPNQVSPRSCGPLCCSAASAGLAHTAHTHLLPLAPAHISVAGGRLIVRTRASRPQRKRTP